MKSIPEHCQIGSLCFFLDLEVVSAVSNHLRSLGIQLPSEKAFNLLKTRQTTFLEGIWIPRGCVFCFFCNPFLAKTFPK